jgi:hypothetical protein
MPLLFSPKGFKSEMVWLISDGLMMNGKKRAVATEITARCTHKV